MSLIRIDKLDEEISMWVDEGHASVCQGGGFFRRSIAMFKQYIIGSQTQDDQHY